MSYRSSIQKTHVVRSSTRSVHLQHIPYEEAWRLISFVAVPVTSGNSNNRECFNPFIDPFHRPYISYTTRQLSHRGHSQSRLLPLQTARLLRLANYRELVVSPRASSSLRPAAKFLGSSHSLSRLWRESSIFPWTLGVNCEVPEHRRTAIIKDAMLRSLRSAD